ncbi:hypothetical protein MUK42_35428 [Musa troglodytarum]|uniref:Uncharacterized protein n=1 Tax=Musa troglodytarum TaxID=320322 RepID=A0A9E7K472_9LILI|nr:hypothetical protein MUK42_35428 [Musa troglodytarum]
MDKRKLHELSVLTETSLKYPIMELNNCSRYASSALCSPPPHPHPNLWRAALQLTNGGLTRRPTKRHKHRWPDILSAMAMAMAMATAVHASPAVDRLATQI